MRNTKTEMKNTLERVNSRLDEADRTSKLEDKVAEYTQSEQKEKRIKKMRIV